MTESMRFQGDGAWLYVYARRFAPGNAILFRIDAENSQPCERCSLYIQGYRADVYPHSKGAWALAGVHPDKADTTWEIRWQVNGGDVNTDTLNLGRADFPVYHQKLNLGKFSQAGYEQKQESIEHRKRSDIIKKEAYRETDDNHIAANFYHPRDEHKITSPFWAKRVYARYRVTDGKKETLKPVERVHRGLDLRGFWGADIYAMNRGRVRMADHLFYEGKTVLIDHGNRVYTAYMHMSEFAVKNGDIVEPGQLIGKTGATGVVTAAHLHVFARIRGIMVDPLSLLHIEIPR